MSGFNKALLNYIFKSSVGKNNTILGENDSRPIESKGLLKKINQDLDDLSIYSSVSQRDLATQEFPIEFEIDILSNINNKNSERIEGIKSVIQTKLLEVRRNLENCKLKVQEALLSERKLIGESYTAVLPLDKDYISKNTTALVENNMTLGVGYESELTSENLLNLDTLYIGAQEETVLKIESETLNSYPLKLKLNKNFYNNYQQIKITLPRITQTGILYLEFDKQEAFSILNRDGYEIIPKHISNTVKFPVNNDSRSFSIRLLENTDREVIVKALYFTEQIYNTTTVYESTIMSVEEDLSLLSVQTCDNYTDKNVNIKYEISVNEREYEEFRPNGKLKENLTQSIIKASILNYENTIKLSNPILDNGVYKFYTNELINSEIKVKAFSWKFKEDFNSVESFVQDSHNHTSELFYNMFFVVKEDIKVVLNSILEFYDNGKLIKEETEGDVYTLKRGIHKIRVLKTLWKETVDLNKFSIFSILENKLTVIERETEEKKTIDFIYNPSEDLVQSTSLYLQIFNKKVDIYLTEEKLNKKLDNAFVEYFFKSNPYPLYVISESVQTRVNTIQIRATMTSLDKVTCPYISNITIRGI